MDECRDIASRATDGGQVVHPFRALGGFVNVNGQWYFSSREGDYGPFSSKREANDALERCIEAQLFAIGDGEKEGETCEPRRLHGLTPEDVKRIRSQTRLSQAHFVSAFNISISTLRSWERGNATPNRTATAYLRVIERHLGLVFEVLNSG